MNVPILVTLISGVVTAAGGVVSHALATRHAERTRQIQAALAFTERQLEELYGPLAFLVWEGRRAFQDLLEALGRDHVFPRDRPLSEADLKTWLFWLDHVFFPKDARIKDLLMAKTHLIEGTVMPPSYLRFLEHHTSWRVEHLRWQQDQVPYAFRSKINWPGDFETDVLETFRTLKSRQARFHGAIQPR